MNRPTQNTGQPAPVFACTGTKPAGDIRPRWEWVAATVWTERMLVALENGVKGGRWFGQTPPFTRWGYIPWNWPKRECANLTETPLTGEPDAGDPPVRFGGRGDIVAPTPINSWPLIEYPAFSIEYQKC